MEVIHCGEGDKVQSRVHRKMVHSTPRFQHILLLVQMNHQRVQDHSVHHPSHVRQVHDNLLQHHHQIAPIFKQMDVVVIVVLVKTLGQGVQRCELGIHHRPFPEDVVVPHKFARTPWFHVKPTKWGLLSVHQFGRLIHDTRMHAGRRLDHGQQHIPRLDWKACRLSVFIQSTRRHHDFRLKVVEQRLSPNRIGAKKEAQSQHHQTTHHHTVAKERIGVVEILHSAVNDSW